MQRASTSVSYTHLDVYKRQAVYSVVKIVVIILVIMVVYRLGSMAYSYGERIFGEPPMESAPGTDIVITVEMCIRDRRRGSLRIRSVWG